MLVICDLFLRYFRRHYSFPPSLSALSLLHVLILSPEATGVCEFQLKLIYVIFWHCSTIDNTVKPGNLWRENIKRFKVCAQCVDWLGV